jgi:hypothetical protein
MSSPIIPIEGPSDPSRVTPPAGSGADDIGAFASELHTGESTFALAASRGGPPREVLEQIAIAGTIDERLRASGQQLRFTPADGERRTRIEIHDRDGNVVRTLSATEAFELAAGRPSE